MSTNAHNKPAFPVSVPGHLYGDGSSEMPYTIEGMTLRQYFAARAPHEIPAFFKPVMPPEPESRWLNQDTGEQAEKHEIESLDFKITKTSPKLGIGTEAKMNGEKFDNVNFPLIEAWHEAYKIQRFAQWPWFWADMVIGAQDTKVDH